MYRNERITICCEEYCTQCSYSEEGHSIFTCAFGPELIYRGQLSEIYCKDFNEKVAEK
jgi:hypothetical protein